MVFDAFCSVCDVFVIFANVFDVFEVVLHCSQHFCNYLLVFRLFFVFLSTFLQLFAFCFLHVFVIFLQKHAAF